MLETGLQFIACSLFPQYMNPNPGADLRQLQGFQRIYPAYLRFRLPACVIPAALRT